MSRKTHEINPIRAERVKTIIKRENITQSAFALMIHQSQQNVSRIVRGRVTLTEETAADIIKAFPRYRLPWLLGFDPYPTESEKASGIMQAASDEQSLLHNAFLSLAQLSGFRVSINQPGPGTAETALDALKSYCTISRDGQTVTFSLSDLNEFENELSDFFEFRLLHKMK